MFVRQLLSYYAGQITGGLPEIQISETSVFFIVCNTSGAMSDLARQYYCHDASDVSDLKVTGNRNIFFSDSALITGKNKAALRRLYLSENSDLFISSVLQKPL